MSAQILEFRPKTEGNPYRLGSIPWKIWNEAEEATNAKWRLAWLKSQQPDQGADA